MVTKKPLIPLLFTILIISTLSSITTTKKVEAVTAYPVVSVSPRVSYGNVGENVNVSIVITNAVELFLYQVYVDYSPTMLSVVDITEGDLLRRGGAYTTFWRAVYNDTRGLAQIANSLLRGGQPVTGDGEAFRITFRINKSGGSALLLHDLSLQNQFNGKIEPVFNQNGTVTTAKLELSPSQLRSSGSEDYSINKTFNVNVTLTGAVSDLYSHDISINYGNGILKATAATLLPFMGTPNTNQTQIDHDNGRIQLSLNCTSPAPSTNTTGTMATITFQVLSLGATDIEISQNSTLTDINGKQIYPLLGFAIFDNAYTPKNIGILSATLASYEATAGDNITLTALIKNEGATNETCHIMAHAQNTITALVAGPTDFQIDANTSQTITLTLRTDGLDGNYTANVFLFYLPEETTHQDNQFTIAQQLLVNPKPEEAPSIFSSTFYYAVAIIAILIAIIAVYYLARRRKAP